jgi:hypothetical protein
MVTAGGKECPNYTRCYLPTTHDIGIPTEDLSKACCHHIYIGQNMDVDKAPHCLVYYDDKVVFIRESTEPLEIGGSEKRI